MDAGFVGEDMFADDRLVERNGARRGRGDDGGDVAEFGQHDAGFAPVQLPERDSDLFERRVAGALAEPDHGDRRMRGAGLDRGQRIGGGEAEIVMAVELELEVGGRAQRGHQRVARIRIEHAERIGDAKAPRAGGLCGGDDLDQEIDIGARRILAADRDGKALAARVSDDALEHVDRVGALAAELGRDLHVGNRHRHIDHRDAGLDRGVDVSGPHPAPGDRGQRQLRLDDGADRGDLLACPSPACRPRSPEHRRAPARARSQPFPLVVKATPGACSPSRSVVSLRTTRAAFVMAGAKGASTCRLPCSDAWDIDLLRHRIGRSERNSRCLVLRKRG